MSKIFVLPEADAKGSHVILGKYIFVDGKMAATDDEAVAFAPILCRFYGCKMIEGPTAPEVNADSNASPSLSAAETKPGAAAPAPAKD